MNNSQQFLHIVNVSQMGIWNSDSPRRFANQATIYTSCISEEEKGFQPLGDVYLIDKKLNACIGHHGNVANGKIFLKHLCVYLLADEFMLRSS